MRCNAMRAMSDVVSLSSAPPVIALLPAGQRAIAVLTGSESKLLVLATICNPLK
jgi:hypothetical protein